MRDSAALVLTEYIALYSLPPIFMHSSLDLDDPAFDAGIKKGNAQEYEWQLPGPGIIDHKSIFEEALSCCNNPI